MSVTRGDRRRSALLAALDEQLREAGPAARLEDINVADLSRRAGVTRSAFYFYFDNKAAAVAALMDDMYDEAWGAADLLGGEGSMRDRTATAIRSVFEGWSSRPHVYRAMLEARATSAAARERWNTHIARFIEVVAAVIDAERVAHQQSDGPPALAIATALMDVNDRALERLVRAPGDRDDFDWETHVDAVVHLWLSSIYGSTS
ncbi:TetR/AcrR family transcriptional regulator [Nocardioides dongkuii]|uniref:TetR/AcrR family transcriptional regulator n=1 Tax=Nocardioides dongkuii TaxID=2760089 RepID=UPI0015F7BF08|nr:TetR/AcrR family transcriptional regulator [Nocardioides dongkuii]